MERGSQSCWLAQVLYKGHAQMFCMHLCMYRCTYVCMHAGMKLQMRAFKVTYTRLHMPDKARPMGEMLHLSDNMKCQVICWHA